MARGVSPRPIVTALLALALSGCVAGATGPSPTDPHGFTTTTTVPVTTTTVGLDQGLAGYRICLADERVTIGDIPTDGLGRPRMFTAFSGLDLSDRAVLNALENCGHHLSSGALELSSDPELRSLVQRSLEQFAECVRLEGVADYPDPVPDFDGVGSPFPVNRIPWTDPGLPQAVASCHADLATR